MEARAGLENEVNVLFAVSDRLPRAASAAIVGVFQPRCRRDGAKPSQSTRMTWSARRAGGAGVVADVPVAPPPAPASVPAGDPLVGAGGGPGMVRGARTVHTKLLTRLFPTSRSENRCRPCRRPRYRTGDRHARQRLPSSRQRPAPRAGRQVKNAVVSVVLASG